MKRQVYLFQIWNERFWILEGYAITPLINPIRTLGIAKDADNVNLYFQNELRELARSTNVLELKEAKC